MADSCKLPLSDVLSQGSLSAESLSLINSATCNGFWHNTDSWTKWDGAQLWRRVCNWGINQATAGQIAIAFPTYRMEGNKHIVVLFPHGAHLYPFTYEGLGGYCGTILTDPNHCKIIGKRVDEFFRNANRMRAPGYTGAIPSLQVQADLNTPVWHFQSAHLHFQDVLSGELGDPDPSLSNPTDFITRFQDYVVQRRQADTNYPYIAAFPTWETAVYPETGRVFGGFFVKDGPAMLRTVYDSELPAPD